MPSAEHVVKDISLRVDVLGRSDPKAYTETGCGEDVVMIPTMDICSHNALSISESERRITRDTLRNWEER